MTSITSTSTEANTPTGIDTRDTERLYTLYAVHDTLKQVVVDGFSIDEVLPSVLRLAVDELRGDAGSILIVDNEGEVEHAWHIADNEIVQNSERFFKEALKNGLFGSSVRSQTPLLVTDTRSDSKWLLRPGHPTSYESWSAVCAPLIMRNHAIGALTMTKSGSDQFDHGDLNLLQAIANQAASTIEIARLFRESERRTNELTALVKASRVINSSLDTNKIMKSLLSQMNQLIKAEAISIALVDHQTNQLVFEVAEGLGSEAIVGLRMPSNQGISGWVMEHGQPAFVPDTDKDVRFNRLGDLRTGHSTRSVICAPIMIKHEMLGTIQAINPSEGKFTENDLQLLTNLANLASSALFNARQFAQTQIAEARYLGLFEDSVNPILLTNARGEIVEANRRAFEMLGYTGSDLLGQLIDILHDKDDNIPSRLYLHPGQVRMFTGQVAKKDGFTIPVEIHAKKTHFRDSELLQWIYRDISQEVELQKMRDDLTAMLVHDLQSPLGNVISSLELLDFELGGNSSSIVHNILDIATRSSRRLQVLIRSLLDINHLEAGHPIQNQRVVTIEEVIDLAKETVQPVLERRNITLVREFDEDLAQIFVDDEMIRRVFINLLDNATKYTPDNKQVTIKVSQDPAGLWLIVAVRDQGAGIPKQFRDVIFDKFRRMKQKGAPKGMGLGLAFCRMAVEAHGGTIQIDDAPGGGAEFRFTLPIA